MPLHVAAERAQTPKPKQMVPLSQGQKTKGDELLLQKV
jgi:hypothetical protein